jgi:DNA polymerase-3 subunit alpha
MAFGSLRDFEGDIDLVFFSKPWSECRDILSVDEFVALKGSIDPANDRNPQKPSFKVSGIADIAALSRSAAKKAAAGEDPKVSATPSPFAPGAAQRSNAPQPATVTTAANASRALHVLLADEAAGRDEGIYPLRNYILEHPGPRSVFIHIAANGGQIIRLNTGISLDAEFKNCAGVIKTWEE